MKKKPVPPRLADRFLEWHCNPELLDEVQGDLYELFQRRIKKYGIRRSRWFYWLNVLMFFQPFTTRRKESQYYTTNDMDMFKNYIRTAIRNLSRHKTYVLINLLGMGFALACCIVAFLNLDYKLRFDEHHLDKTTSVYRVNTVRDTENGKEPWGTSPVALGSVISQDLTGVNRIMRLHHSNGIVKANDKTFGETIHYADMDLLKIFNFPLLYGNSTAFDDPKTVVLTPATALKYFGDENPIGKELVIIDQFKRENTFIVGAVMQKIPENTSILFNLMISISHAFEPTHFPEHDWKAEAQITTFVELTEGHAPADINKMLDQYVAVHNVFREDFKVSDFYLQPFKELAFTSDIDLPGEVKGRALNRNAVGFLVGITTFLSLLILLTACFNFTNTSIAFSSNRLKEIGIRKVIGGARHQLIKQFMVENLVLCILSIGIGLLGAQYLTEAYNGLFDQSLDMRYVFKSRVLIFLIALPVVTALFAGSYPAFYISKHQPVAILKGRTKFATMGKFSKVLLTAQFSFSCFAIIAGIILTQNAAYQEHLDFGYDLRKIAVTAVNNSKEFTGFQNAIEQNANIGSIAGSSQIVGQSYEVPVKTNPDDPEMKVRRLEVGSNYLQTVGIGLLAGRDFIESSASDLEQAVIVNQKLIEDLQWKEDPLNKQIFINGKPYHIIGLAENHKELGLLGEEPACLFTLVPPSEFKYLSVNVPVDQLAEVNNGLMQTWFQVNPDVPYEGFLQEMLIFKQLYMNIVLRNLCFFLAVATLIMSAAGFFSIVSLSVLKRTKEIGIRKVFGGSVKQMMHLISRDFIKFILIAFVVGSLLGYLVIEEVLFNKMYVYHIPLGVGAFGLTLFIMLLVPGLTVGLRVYKAATANPSEILRYE